MTGRHRWQRPNRPRWIGLTIMALLVIAISFAVAPLIANADVMPPGPLTHAGRQPVAPCAAQTKTWGSLPKTNPVMAPGPIVALRAGRHACFDRLVVDVRGPAPGFSARYVTTVTADGSGLPVTVPGGARIEFVVRAPAHNVDTGAATLGALPSVSGFTALRSVVAAGDFEGISTFGVGVRARLPFRVFVLAGTGGTSHVVLDVAHRWAA
jgi:hypothetical protein